MMTASHRQLNAGPCIGTATTPFDWARPLPILRRKWARLPNSGFCLPVRYLGNTDAGTFDYLFFLYIIPPRTKPPTTTAPMAAYTPKAFDGSICPATPLGLDELAEPLAEPLADPLADPVADALPVVEPATAVEAREAALVAAEPTALSALETTDLAEENTDEAREATEEAAPGASEVATETADPALPV